MVDKNKRVGIVALLLVILLIAVAFASNTITGESILGINIAKTYSSNEMIEGTLEIVLTEGELLPADSVVRLKTTSNGFYEYKLSNVAESAAGFRTNGQYYIEGANIIGRGDGYGVEGPGRKPVKVEFEAIVYPEEKKVEYEDYVAKDSSTSIVAPPKGNDIVVVQVEGVGVGGGAEPIGGGGEGDEGGAGEEEGGGLPGGGAPTGLAIGEIGSGGSSEGASVQPSSETQVSSGGSSRRNVPRIDSDNVVDASEIPGVIDGEADVISGSVDRGESFVRVVEGEDKKVGIVSGSVKIGGVKAADDAVKLKFNNGFVTVTTDYYEEGTGFGRDYLGDRRISIKIPLERFGILAKGDGLEEIDASLIWKDKVLDYTFEEFNVKNLDVEVPVDADVSIERMASRAVVNNPVEWNVLVSLTHSTEELRLLFPESVQDLEVAGVVRSNSADLESVVVDLLTDEFEIVEKEGGIDDSSSEDSNSGSNEESSSDVDSESAGVTGQVTTDILLGEEGFFEGITDGIRNLFGFEGPSSAVQESSDIEVGNVISSDSLLITENENGFVKKAEIVYHTPAVESYEERMDRGKRVFVIPPEDFVYENVLVWTDISESFNVRNEEMVRVYWVEEGEYVSPVVLDKNGDSLMDYVEWAVPILESEQTYVVEFSYAQHLDSERVFIRDISESVVEIDEDWSDTIDDGEFIRVSFEKVLTADNKIGIYPRVVSGEPRIEVYLPDKEEPLSVSGVLVDGELNELSLEGLEDGDSLFYLGVGDGSVGVNKIIDPSDNEPEIEFDGITPRGGEGRRLGKGDIPVALNTEDETRHYSLVDFGRDLNLWLVMEEVNSDGEFLDLSSYHRTINTRGGVSRDETVGYWGDSAKFDGSGYISFNRASRISDFGSDDEFTVSAWVKFEDDLNMHILSDVSSNGKGWALRYVQGGVIEFVVSDGQITTSCSHSITPDNQWHFVAGSYFAGSVDCMLGNSWRTAENYEGGDFSNNNGLSIGSLNGESNAAAFVGNIDDVLIFERHFNRDTLYSFLDSDEYQFYSEYPGINRVQYPFQGHAVDVFGQRSNTEIRIVEGVLSCLSICVEDSDCHIAQPCNLAYNECTDDICNFKSLTIDESVHTLHERDGKGKDLILVIEEGLEFGNKGAFVFNGLSGQQGGNGGNLKITVGDLFKPDESKFIGFGGFSDQFNRKGGDGGNVEVVYHGLNGPGQPEVDLSGGRGRGGHNTVKGKIGMATFTKDTTCDPTKGETRDEDVTNDGRVTSLDIIEITDGRYNAREGDAEYVPELDIDCDGELDVVEIARMGMDFGRGT